MGGEVLLDHGLGRLGLNPSLCVLGWRNDQEILGLNSSLCVLGWR